MDKGDVRLEAGDVLAAVLALLLLLGVRLALVVAHLEEVLEGFSTHGAVEIATSSLISRQNLASIDSNSRGRFPFCWHQPPTFFHHEPLFVIKGKI